MFEKAESICLSHEHKGQRGWRPFPGGKWTCPASPAKGTGASKGFGSLDLAAGVMLAGHARKDHQQPLPTTSVLGLSDRARNGLQPSVHLPLGSKSLVTP